VSWFACKGVGMLIIMISLLVCFSPIAHATDSLSAFEQSTFGIAFIQDSSTDRITRIEQVIYGPKYTPPGGMTVAERWQRIRQTQAKQVLKGPSQGLLSALDQRIPEGGEVIRFDGQSPETPIFKVSNATLARIEQRLFKRGIPPLSKRGNESEARLARLEERLFGQVSPVSVDPAARWQRIQAVLAANPDGEGGLDDVNRNRFLEAFLPVAAGLAIMAIPR
jgi:hypothetical protein